MSQGRTLNDAAAIHDAHVRGGIAAHRAKSYEDDWRAHYGQPPRGDPNRRRCSGCSHLTHAPGACSAIATFTHAPCRCTVNSVAGLGI